MNKSKAYSLNNKELTVWFMRGEFISKEAVIVILI